MTKSQSLEEEIEKKFSKNDSRKKQKMKISGKNVFKLKKIITQKSPRQKASD